MAWSSVLKSIVFLGYKPALKYVGERIFVITIHTVGLLTDEGKIIGETFPLLSRIVFTEFFVF